MNDFDKIFSHLGKDILLEEYLSGRLFYHPPTGIWNQKLRFEEIKNAWQNVSDKIIKKENNYDKIGLYVHIPFCQRRCIYCQFDGFPEAREEQHRLYIKCLENEIKLLDFPKRVKFNSVYIGGGTPSILSPQNLIKLFNMLYKHFGLSQVRQIAIDIHPETTTLEKIKIFKDFGVNRVTVGVQSLDQNLLKATHRIQEKKSVLDTYYNLRKIGIQYINIDIMAGLPGQTIISFIATLKETLKLKPDTVHINVFTPDIITPFHLSGKRLTPSELRERVIMGRLAYKIISDAHLDIIEKSGSDSSNIQMYNLDKFNSSILGIGYAALSHANNNLLYLKEFNYKSYLNSMKNRSFPNLLGYRLDSTLEMRAHVIKNLEMFGYVSYALFEKIFKKNMKQVFKKEIGFLARTSRIKNDREKLEIAKTKHLENEICPIIFYDNSVLKQMIRNTKSRSELYSDQYFELLFLASSLSTPCSSI
ncbi:MAG: radical SAM protein [Candidatus Omnitrophica bacterium]|nr:radical SAM protein [Candidatus Omnitrophota bacterium]